MFLKKMPFVACIALLIGCGGGGENRKSPEETVLQCMTALENFDVAIVRKLVVSTPQNDAMLAAMESAASSMSDAQKQAYKMQFKDRKHEVAIETEDDEAAIITVTADEGQGMGFTFELVYIDGAWKIESLAQE